MRVLISFAQNDADLAAELEAALRRHDIQAWSRLDLASGEDWCQLLAREGEHADGFIFLLGPGFASSPQLQAEWRSLLRSDWDSKKPLVPVVAAHGADAELMPPFLRSRKAIYTTDFDAIVEELQYLIEHPAESLDRTHAEQARAEQQERLSSLREHALALKEHPPKGEATP